ncbi:terminase large subunit [Limnoglobus roseus]|uniref:Terminase large subunit n=1 Tax=Limnoglobus roseus TaxID=2598579 RepID=A0A5C1ANU6_9BACT|nr:terminase large subunit [Limnoglobus roseus]QEL18538.1 terminase large subunit [Limnoglobus roseus]
MPHHCPDDKRPPAWAVRTAADRKALEAGCFWDAAAAERVIRFVEKYVTSRFIEGELRLFEWQVRFLQSLYGWRSADGTRRFKTALLHVPKKNGKTLLVSAIAAYELFGAVQPKPLVVSASTTLKNAEQVFDNLKSTVNKKGNEKLKAISNPVPSENLIEVPKREGEYKALSSDEGGSEGLNCSCVIVDEAHKHKSPALFNTLEYATLARPDGILIIISTAGDDLTHWYYGYVRRGRNLLEGKDLDPTFYAELYEAKETDNLEDPAVWKRANPSLDLYDGYTSERFASTLATAKKDTAAWLNFVRYRLNIFCRSEDAVWIQLAEWDHCRESRPAAAVLAGCRLWLGLDGSQTTDPTSLSAVWLLPDKRYYAESHAWVAEDGVRKREKSNLPKYAQFVATNCMTITPGNLMDKNAVLPAILAYQGRGQLQQLVMDGSMVWVFGSEMTSDHGIKAEKMPQSNRYFGPVVKQFKFDVLERRLIHDGNEWLRWCINAVRLDVNKYDEGRPYRKKSADHIDGAVSLLMAYSQAVQAAAVPEQSSAGVIFL